MSTMTSDPTITPIHAEEGVSPPCIRVFMSGSHGVADTHPRRVRNLAALREAVIQSAALPHPGESHAPFSPLRPSPGDPAAFIWVDLKRLTPEMTEEVLAWLPVHVLTERKIREGSTAERLEYFPSHGYTFLTMTARRRGAAIPRSADEPMVVLHVVAFDTAIVTFSTDDFEGEERIDCHVARDVAGPAEGAAMRAVSSIFSSLVSTVTLKMLNGVGPVLIEADQLDELVLQIMPSEVDQDDLLLRIKEMRHRVAKYHVDLLFKERLLKQLLLPTIRQTAVCHDTKAVQRYQRSLTLTRSSIEKLRKGRDVVNLSSMSLVSGVSARLVQHCHFMDYMNHVQGQIALVVMPICIIPGLWAMNVRVPFKEMTTMTPFWCLVSVTFFVLVLGLLRPMIKYFQYKPPGALVPSLD